MSFLSRIPMLTMKIWRRHLGITAVTHKGVATDPIQKLFIQKIKEYDEKAKANPGKLVDSNPQIEKELSTELERIAKIYGGGGNVDMTKFPNLNFRNPVLDPINQQSQ